MMDPNIVMNPNQIVTYLNKPSQEFTKADLIKFIQENEIKMVNFRYIGGDGKLKTLNFVISSRTHLDRLLSTGERVDGSSLFSYVDAGSSDLYVIPRFSSAFVNPFAEIPTVDLLCSYYTSEGEPLPSSPENIIRSAHNSLKESTGMTLEAMGELEYYVFFDRQHLYPVMAQKGYQESAPFSKWENFRCEAMHAIAQTGGKIKYGHSEVGDISGEDTEMEQHEIEFHPVPLEEAADQLVIAKWVLRMIGYKYGVMVSFAPKIIVGHAGSGLHIHTRMVKDGKNMMVDGDKLSDTARKVIAGFLKHAQSLTAFGNTIPVSYLRLVPHQEAPTNVCWGDRNRSVLVRVPLGWLGDKNMIGDANPQDKVKAELSGEGQTVEFRAPDGSADIYLLLAGLAVAARDGMESEDSLKIAEDLYVDVNIFADEHKDIQKKLPNLPASCWDSAESLLKDRAVFEKNGVFTKIAIDGIAKQLQSYKDKDLSERLYRKTSEIQQLVNKYLHWA
ncbi:MAG: glutamine synthetase [bacterium]|nr:glutamine synthetase [bacterium]